MLLLKATCMLTCKKHSCHGVGPVFVICLISENLKTSCHKPAEFQIIFQDCPLGVKIVQIVNLLKKMDTCVSGGMPIMKTYTNRILRSIATVGFSNKCKNVYIIFFLYLKQSEETYTVGIHEKCLTLCYSHRTLLRPQNLNYL